MLRTIFLMSALFLSLTSFAVAEELSDTAADTVASFEKLFGVSEGKRRNHTKGFCFEATLIPKKGRINALSTSELFSSDSKVTGRFSHKGGNAYASDDVPAEYGMGLEFHTASNERHLMALNTLDFFPVATPQAFAELMRAKVKGKDAVKAFKASNNNLQRFKIHSAKQPKRLIPYEGATYNSINSFYLINDASLKTAVRWSFVPSSERGIVLDPSEDFFFDNMRKNLANGPLSWDMVVTLSLEGDDVANAAIPWEGKRDRIVAATLTVNTISTEDDGACTDINFDPTVLSSGMEVSEDPLLLARSASYAISFSRRISEKN